MGYLCSVGPLGLNSMGRFCFLEGRAGLLQACLLRCDCQKKACHLSRSMEAGEA